MSSATKPTVNPAIAARVALISGVIPITNEMETQLSVIQVSYADLAHTIRDTFSAGRIDIGRAIAALDELENSKNIARNAIILANFNPNA